MDYLTLLQRPILAVKYDQSSRSLKTAGGGPLDDFWYQPATNSDDTDPATLFRSVAWVYRSVDLRAHAVASMPFRITSANGETELDTSDNYQNKLGWLPNSPGPAGRPMGGQPEEVMLAGKEGGMPPPQAGLSDLAKGAIKAGTLGAENPGFNQTMQQGMTASLPGLMSMINSRKRNTPAGLSLFGG